MGWTKSRGQTCWLLRCMPSQVPQRYAASTLQIATLSHAKLLLELSPGAHPQPTSDFVSTCVQVWTHLAIHTHYENEARLNAVLSMLKLSHCFREFSLCWNCLIGTTSGVCRTKLSMRLPHHKLGSQRSRTQQPNDDSHRCLKPTMGSTLWQRTDVELCCSL